MREWKLNEKVEVVLDETGEHRLKFVCSWEKDLPRCLFIMLNPSTADSIKCDRTLDKCIKIAQHNGFGSIAVVNLFSLRSPSPKDLLETDARIHAENIGYIKAEIDDAKIIVAAWGEQGVWFNGCYPVLKYLEQTGRELYCLGENRYGWPRHPLFMKSDLVFKEYVYGESVSVGIV